MSNLRLRSIDDLARRIVMLPREIAGFMKAAADNTAGFGIHKTQVEALQLLMRGLLDDQTDLLGQLTPAVSEADFANGASTLLVNLACAQDLWRLFSSALTQRQRADLVPRLDAADLVAADCYHRVTGALQNFGLAPRGQGA